MEKKEERKIENLKLIDYTKKRLDDMYIIMYAIKNEINMNKGEMIWKRK